MRPPQQQLTDAVLTQATIVGLLQRRHEVNSLILLQDVKFVDRSLDAVEGGVARLDRRQTETFYLLPVGAHNPLILLLTFVPIVALQVTPIHLVRHTYPQEDLQVDLLLPLAVFFARCAREKTHRPVVITASPSNKLQLAHVSRRFEPTRQTRSRRREALERLHLISRQLLGHGMEAAGLVYSVHLLAVDAQEAAPVPLDGAVAPAQEGTAFQREVSALNPLVLRLIQVHVPVEIARLFASGSVHVVEEWSQVLRSHAH